MLTWIKFIALPLVTLLLLQLTELIIMSWMLGIKPGGWASYLSGFVVMFSVGGNIYFVAPKPRIPPSLLYSATLIGLFVYLDLLNDSKTVQVLGQSITHQFSLSSHITDSIGLVAGILLAYYGKEHLEAGKALL